MTTDEKFIQECIALARIGAHKGELPFGSYVVDAAGEMLGGSTQLVKARDDMSAHAETVALDYAYKANGNNLLHGCTLYSTVEPCCMCAFMARSYQVQRMVFGLWSPVMGGCSHWPVLQDEGLNRSEMGLFDVGFAPPPEIVGGVLADEVAKGWADWNLVAWEAMRLGGIFATERSK